MLTFDKGFYQLSIYAKFGGVAENVFTKIFLFVFRVKLCALKKDVFGCNNRIKTV